LIQQSKNASGGNLINQTSSGNQYKM